MYSVDIYMNMMYKYQWLSNFSYSSYYIVSQKKGYPLKSSASATCSNLNALTP